MATLELQGKSIEMETISYSYPHYYAKVNFNTPESENEKYCRSVEVKLSGDSRSDMTFEQVQEEINQYFEENHPDIEISEFLSISVVEKEKIKQRPFDNYEY